MKSQNKTLVYIPAFIPYGTGESFILEEARHVKEIHKNFMIIPRNPPREVFHEKAADLLQNTLTLPLFNLSIVLTFLMSLLSWRVWVVLKDIVINSRSLFMVLKNLAVLPKSLYVDRILKSKNVGHIHANWAGTTATMAYLIHRLSGIPYSFTMHRWDIYENNMLKEKVRAALFSRCISAKGKIDLLTIIGREFEDKVRVIHMGVELPVLQRADNKKRPFTIFTPANLLPVKGHRYLIEACEILKNKELNFQYWCAGGGPLKEELEQMVRDKGIQDQVKFYGCLPHEKVIQMYKDQLVDVMVLPSIHAGQDVSEGIPVALMEAMSYGIAVVSTDTGAISELLGDASGVIVAQKDPFLLADAIEKLAKDRQLYNQFAKRGREKIEKDFNISKTSTELIDAMAA